MSDVVNLRLARKRKRRTEAEREAAANRAEHGRPKAETEACALTRALDAKRHQGHRRTPDDA